MSYASDRQIYGSRLCLDVTLHPSRLWPAALHCRLRTVPLPTCEGFAFFSLRGLLLVPLPILQCCLLSSHAEIELLLEW